jgi:hypothetical protein
VITLKDTLQQELELVENYISFLNSRRTGGLLYIPEELTFPEDGGYDDNEESFEQVLMDYMVEAARDGNSAASIVPIILRGPAEFHDQIRHIDLDGDFYATLCARAYKIKAQLEELDKG